MNKKVSDILFNLGFFLIIIGAVGLTFMVFFAYFGLPLFLIGCLLILLSKKELKTKLITTLSVLGVILLFWSLWTWSKNVTPETFLISKDYRGKVNIIHGQSCGRHQEGLLVIASKEMTSFAPRQLPSRLVVSIVHFIWIPLETVMKHMKLLASEKPWPCDGNLTLSLCC